MPTPTAADLLQPLGPVAESFYPDDAPPPATGDNTVITRLTTYITRAVSKVAGYSGMSDVDGAVRLWALYLAFEAAYLIKISKPLNENMQVPVLGSFGYGSQQITELRSQMLQYKTEFDVKVTGPGAPQPSSTQSISAPTSTIVGW